MERKGNWKICPFLWGQAGIIQMAFRGSWPIFSTKMTTKSEAAVLFKYIFFLNVWHFPWAVDFFFLPLQTIHSQRTFTFLLVRESRAVRGYFFKFSSLSSFKVVLYATLPQQEQVTSYRCLGCLFWEHTAQLYSNSSQPVKLVATLATEARQENSKAIGIE